MTKCKILVMGVGNVLLTDEGTGIHILKELEKRNLPEGTQLLDGGTAGIDLRYLIEETDHLVIVDSIDAGAEPGAIFKFKPDDLAVTSPGFAVSGHQLGLIDLLKLDKIYGKLPRSVVVFAVQPKSLDWGLELTQEVKAIMPKLIELVVEEVCTLAKKRLHPGCDKINKAP